MTAANTTFPLLPSPFLPLSPSLLPTFHRVTRALMEPTVLLDPKVIPVHLEERECPVYLASTELTVTLVMLE